MHTQTPKNFVIQLGSLVALYISLGALLVLLFGIINLKFPDELEYYYTAESAREGMRGAIAFLVVFFPTYLLLTRISNQSRRQETAGEYTTLAKWLVYISILVGGGVILGDLVTLLMYFLNGEITTRFILKAGALLVVVGAALSYYILDARGHFKTNVQQSINFGIGAAVVIAAILVYGFMNIETPAEVREMKLDDQQVMNLQEVQFRIEEYYRVENRLPANMADIYTSGQPPTAPTGRGDYEYRSIDDTTYELCATFIHPSSENINDYSMAYPMEKDNYNWDHGEGKQCFKRVVVPNPTEVKMP